jgi:dTDP-4-amino-4,6-dideoxygalactose transaminase
LGHGAGSYPESERAAGETLALPIYPELSDGQLQYVVESIGASLAKSISLASLGMTEK